MLPLRPVPLLTRVADFRRTWLLPFYRHDCSKFSWDWSLTVALFLRLESLMAVKQNIWSETVLRWGRVVVCLLGMGMSLSVVGIKESATDSLTKAPPIPSLNSIPPTLEGDDIRLGYRVIVQTSTFAKGFIGNR